MGTEREMEEMEMERGREFPSPPPPHSIPSVPSIPALVPGSKCRERKNRKTLILSPMSCHCTSLPSLHLTALPLGAPGEKEDMGKDQLQEGWVLSRSVPEPLGHSITLKVASAPSPCPIWSHVL